MAGRETQSSSLGRRIASLDTDLFETIASLTTDQDRRSLLALHEACRPSYGTFEYLEIGSYHGGSLQALVRDPSCASIVSIDARPSSQPDARGTDFFNLDNSTERMLDRLRAIPGADVAKITTLDASTQTLDPARVPARPALCFIDGEHTDGAAYADARFCAATLAGAGAIAFHDAQIVYGGIGRFIDELRESGAEMHCYVLPDSLFVIELGRPRLLESDAVRARLADSWRAYLWSLNFNDGYRRAFTSRLARALRRARILRVELGRHN